MYKLCQHFPKDVRSWLEAGLRSSLGSDAEKLQKEDPVIGLWVHGSKASQNKLCQYYVNKIMFQYEFKSWLLPRGIYIPPRPIAF